MGAVFQHEKHPYPPSLSDRGKLRLGKKSDLLRVLTHYIQHSLLIHSMSKYSTVLLWCTSYLPRTSSHLTNMTVKHLERSTRVDVVWETYITSSIKESTREKQGKCIRQKVAGQIKLPWNWQDFLRDPTNKQELFTYLSRKITSLTGLMASISSLHLESQ
jgi:hypothetical protein